MIDLQHNRVWDWLRRNFFSSPFNIILTFVLLFVAAKLLWNFFDWAVLRAMWNGDAETCRQGDGACWAYVREKARYVLFGHYPYEEQWRPQLFVGIFFALSLLTQFKHFWSKYLTMAWVVLPLGAAVLMWGGFFRLATR